MKIVLILGKGPASLSKREALCFCRDGKLLLEELGISSKEFSENLYRDVLSTYASYVHVFGIPGRDDYSYLMKFYVMNWQERHLFKQIMYGMPVSGSELSKTASRWERISSLFSDRLRRGDDRKSSAKFEPMAGYWYIFEHVSMRYKSGSYFRVRLRYPDGSWGDDIQMTREYNKLYKRIIKKSVRDKYKYDYDGRIVMYERSRNSSGLYGYTLERFAYDVENYYMREYGSMELYLWHIIYELRYTSAIYEELFNGIGIPEEYRKSTKLNNWFKSLFPIKGCKFRSRHGTFTKHRGYVLTYAGREWLETWLRTEKGLGNHERLMSWWEANKADIEYVPYIAKRQCARRLQKPRETKPYVGRGRDSVEQNNKILNAVSALREELEPQKEAKRVRFNKLIGK